MKFSLNNVADKLKEESLYTLTGLGETSIGRLALVIRILMIPVIMLIAFVGGVLAYFDGMGKRRPLILRPGFNLGMMLCWVAMSTLVGPKPAWRILSEEINQ